MPSREARTMPPSSRIFDCVAAGMAMLSDFETPAMSQPARVTAAPAAHSVPNALRNARRDGGSDVDEMLKVFISKSLVV